MGITLTSSRVLFRKEFLFMFRIKSCIFGMNGSLLQQGRKIGFSERDIP
jgi:hypothetical protein